MNNEILSLFSTISQIVIGMAFIAMPILLVRLYQKRKDLPFCQTTMVFCVLLLFNGILILIESPFVATHLYLLTTIRFLTASSAACAVVFLWKVVPVVLTLRNPNELQESEARFKEFLDLAPDGIIVADQNFKISLVNIKMTTMLDCQKSDLINTSLENLVNKKLSVAKFQLGVTEDQFVNTKNGTPVAVIISFTPVFIDQQLMLIASFHEVGEQKHLERLAGIGQMVTGLAHESRNCLQRSQAALELISWKPLTEDVSELVKNAQDAHDDLNSLFDEIRYYAIKPRLKLSECNLEDVIDEAWQDLNLKRIDKTAVLDLDCSLDVQIDRLAYKRVFRNILENSLASADDNVFISAVLTTVRGQHILSIKDNGPGLNDEQRKKIFDPFFTTKTKGTGLGMAIVKRIVEEHKGTIQLGNPSNGTEILIAFN